ncbi:MAG TPA: hypothetical protein V6C95_08230 [Coleofasciculaceae cyanobacterium]
MKLFKHWIIVPATLAILATTSGGVRSQPLELRPGFQPDPVVVNGTTGGSPASTNCGVTGATQNVQVSLGANFNYLRFSVQSSGQPTLLIEGPSGSSCIQADSLSGGKIQAPGLWEQGLYKISIGNRIEGQHSYTLSITQSRN